MRFDHLPVAKDLGARGADIRGGTLPVSLPAQSLGLQTMEIGKTPPLFPIVSGAGSGTLCRCSETRSGSAFDLFADEAILRRHDVVRELPVAIEDVAKPVAEVGVLSR